jgi:hypothetical protein
VLVLLLPLTAAVGAAATAQVVSSSRAFKEAASGEVPAVLGCGPRYDPFSGRLGDWLNLDRSAGPTGFDHSHGFCHAGTVGIMGCVWCVRDMCVMVLSRLAVGVARPGSMVV